MTNPRIKSLNAVIHVQLDRDTWKESPYMHGLTNGLLLAKAILEDKEVKFMELPKDYFEVKEKLKQKQELK